MSRAGALADRILRRHPHAGDERSVIDDLAEQANPYPDNGVPPREAADSALSLPAGQRMTFRPQPAFTPDPSGLRETRPIPVAAAYPRRRPRPAAAVAVAPGVPPVDVLRRVRNALAPVPLHDEVKRNFRPEVRPEHRHGEAAAARVAAVEYPKPDVTAPDHAVAYIEVMKHYDRITGTQGCNRWRLPALPPKDERWDSLAEAVWAAARWYDDAGNLAKAEVYERLYDAVIAAPDFGSADALVCDALREGTAQPGDITVAPVELIGGAR